MRKNIDIVDLFDEENKKKEKKMNRKLEKIRRKEEKKQRKLNKKLEQQENEDFDKYLEKVKEENIIEEPIKIKETDNYLFLYPNKVSAVPIPKKEFSPEELSTIKVWVNSAKVKK